MQACFLIQVTGFQGNFTITWRNSHASLLSNAFCTSWVSSFTFWRSYCFMVPFPFDYQLLNCFSLHSLLLNYTFNNFKQVQVTHSTLLCRQATISIPWKSSFYVNIHLLFNMVTIFVGKMILHPTEPPSISWCASALFRYYKRLRLLWSFLTVIAYWARVKVHICAPTHPVTLGEAKD